MNTCTATAAALRRTASSIDRAISSFDRSSLRIDGPPLARSTTPPRKVGGIEVRSTPRVHIRVSAQRASGAMSRSMRSSPVVGPWK